jgi:hypothetical protein
MKIYTATFPNEFGQRITLNNMKYTNILASYYFCKEYNFKEYYEDLSSGYDTKRTFKIS